MSTASETFPYPGARWWKFDFHNHTPASTDYGKGRPDQEALKARTPEEWLLDYMREGIDCVAITDHNSGAWITKLQEARKKMEEEKPEGYRDIYLFPGVELSIGRCHYLAIFDPTSSQEVVDGLIGFARYRGTQGASDGTCETSVVDIAREVANKGGLFIPAHVDKVSGIFEELRGNDLRPVLACDAIMAMEVIADDFETPQLYKEAKCEWARVLGTDSHHPDAGADGTGERYPGSHFTWVKMDKPAIEGLRLATVDGNEFSLVASTATTVSNMNSIPSLLLEKVVVRKARLMGMIDDGEAVQFSPWLNSFVGGRGSGKSTVLEYVRTGLGRDADLPKFLEKRLGDFKRVPKNKRDTGTLRPETEVELTYRKDSELFRITWVNESGGNHKLEQFNAGAWASAEGDVLERFPLRIFSQREIAGLAEQPGAVLKIIDDAPDVQSRSLRQSIDEQSTHYLTACSNIRELKTQLQDEPRQRGALDDVKNKLKLFEEGENAATLKESEHCKRQESVLTERNAWLDTVSTRLKEVTDGLEWMDVPADLFDPEDESDKSAIEYIESVKAMLKGWREQIEKVTSEVEQASTKRAEQFESIAWQDRRKAAKDAYEELARRMEEQGIHDLKQHGRLVRERNEIEEKLKKFEPVRDQITKAETTASESLETLKQLRRDWSQKRREFIANSLSDNKHVRIYLEPHQPGLEIVEQELRAILGCEDDNKDNPRFANDILAFDGDDAEGLIARVYHNIPPGGDITEELQRRWDAVKNDIMDIRGGSEPENYGGRFRNFLKNLSSEAIDKLMIWMPDDGLRVEYSPSGDGRDFKALEQGSLGQRSAAMLAFILAQGDEPLILDQPEDDLDNSLIYQLIVQQIAASKSRRQVIVATHNPNIVVNGDSELVMVMTHSNGQCKVEQSGCLQHEDVRDSICTIMEGGREAFDRRYHRIGKKIHS